MTSVLPYRPLNDPFAVDSVTRAYPSPPFTPSSQARLHIGAPSPPPPSSKRTAPPPPLIMPSSGRPSTAGAVMAVAVAAPVSNVPSNRQQRASTPTSATLDDFGSYPAGSSSASTSAARTSASAPVPIPPMPDQHAATAGHRQRNRQSHNPTSTFANASPPKAEYLTDEYVLHPSVYSYKQAHPRRPMVGFGPYVLLQTLGEGEFGKVKLGVHTEFGVEVAIKLIRRGSLDDEQRASKVEREIDVLKSLKHPNIVRMFDVIDTEKYIGIVLEFAGGGELFDYILASRYLKEKDAQKLFAQLISGVDYLHKKHIVHRDLKLENLLLDKHRNIIITDFGFANRFDHEQDDLMATSCGSPCYAAPELVVSEGLYVGSAVDIWSCGVILYAMLSGYLPYDDDPQNPDGDNINLLYKYIMSTKLNFPDHMSDSAKDLLRIMLVPNPEHRCRIEHIMRHPWLSLYQDIFQRTVENHEYLFQESMYRKSQTAKRELAERRKVQIEGKLAKLAVTRSQSSVPGTTVTAGMLDQHRRGRETRHHSAMPTTTMPVFLNKAADSTPLVPPPVPAQARQSLPLPSPLVVAAAAQASSASAPMPPPPQVSQLPSPPESSTDQVASPRQRSESMGLDTSPKRPAPAPSPALDSNEAVENEPMEVDTAPIQGTAPHVPMSANKNRHTIQVEYDGEASYERMKEVLRQKRAAAANSASIPSMPAPRPASPSSEKDRMAASDVEMESGSDMGHTEEGTMESAVLSEGVTPAASQVLTPPAATPPTATVIEAASDEFAPIPIASDPTTPSKKGKEPIREQATSPTTPKATRREDVLEDIVTPKASKKPTVSTPRSGGKRAESTPASAVLPPPPPPSSETTPVPKVKSSLKPSGLPQVPSPKRDRYRKGMSLDKFGLAKLLGQAHANSNVSLSSSRPPVSASATAAANIQAQSAPQPQQENGLFRSRSGRSKRQSAVRPAVEGDGEEKKTRRRTLQLIANRGQPSRDGKAGPAALAPLTTRDMNPTVPPAPSATTVSGKPAGTSSPLMIDSEGIQPVQAPERGQSSPSIVTVDAITAQQTSPPGHKTASSSAAKKVMDWFRKKSIARDTLVSLKQAGVKSDSASSFVQVSDSPIRAASKNAQAKIGSSANLQPMSSMSSVANTAEGPSSVPVDSVLESAMPQQSTPSKVNVELPPPLIIPVAAPSASQKGSGSDTPTRVPLGPASNKTNIENSITATSTASLVPAARNSTPLPSRAKSHMPSSTAATNPIASTVMPTKVPLRATSSGSPRTDELKMRVHTGLVDQSALSSKPPREVIHEVLSVLQGMGMEIKKENDFKLRCTRVRRRKAGATTGLGLGSVMSVGSGMSPFTLMSSASTSKTDGRGLPMPNSPSTGGILSSASGGLKGMLLRRGSSYSASNSLSRTASGGPDSDILGSPSTSTIGFGSPLPGTPGLPALNEPLYGEHSVDSGDEVKFIVELCRIRNLPGLYLLTIKRLRGSVWSFKFIYQTTIERCETLTH